MKNWTQNIRLFYALKNWIKNDRKSIRRCASKTCETCKTVKTVETVETVVTVETVETVETVDTVETVETAETVYTEDLKKYDSLTY